MWGARKGAREGSQGEGPRGRVPGGPRGGSQGEGPRGRSQRRQAGHADFSNKLFTDRTPENPPRATTYVKYIYIRNPSKSSLETFKLIRCNQKMETRKTMKN